MLENRKLALEYAENIIETVRDPLLVLDPSLKILTANQSFYNNFKVMPEDTIGNFIYDLGNRQWDIPKLRTLLEEILPQKNVFNDYEVEHDFPNIGHRVIRLNARQIFRGDVGSHIILLAMEDITEREQAATALRISEKKFSNIFHCVPALIGISTLKAGKIIDSNQTFLQTLGYRRDEVIGKTVYELGLWEDASQRVEMIGTLQEQGSIRDLEVRLKAKNGQSLIGLFSAELLDINGDWCMLSIVRDITELRRAEDALTEKRRELEELNRSLEVRIAKAVDDLCQKDQMLILKYRQAVLGELINNIAHQWRQPLNTLGLIVQQLPLNYGSVEFSLEFLKENTANAMNLIKQMSRTIDDFRNFFRTDEAVIAFSVNQVIALTLSLLTESFKDQKIGIVLDTEGDPLANGYPHQYSQVILNILMNARDALIANNVDAARISIHVFSEEGKTVVTITDNAGGIAEENMGKLFDPYFTTKGPDKGIGIGLYMSKTIVEKNMGGRLTVRNTGSGAEFRIEV